MLEHLKIGFQMPQIWMTYLELSELLKCTTAEARALAVERSLDRKKSHDGLSRAKLDSQLSDIYVVELTSREHLLRPERQLDEAIIELQNVFLTMSTDVNSAVKKAG